MTAELQGVTANDFYAGTRLKTMSEGVISKPAGANGGLSPALQLDRVGFLQGVYVEINATVAGTISDPNTKGMAQLVPLVRLIPNAANDIYYSSLWGYKKLLDPYLGSEYFPFMGDVLNQANDAVSADDFKLFMYIPVAMNRRDALGLFNLQNPQTTVRLEILWASDAAMATGVTSITATANVLMDIMDIFNPRILPPQDYIHQCAEDNTPFTAGDLQYQPQLGQKYLQVNHLICDDTGAYADNWTRFRTVIGGTDIWNDYTNDHADVLYQRDHNAARPAGVVGNDFLASTELGTLSGLDRDVFDTVNITDYRQILSLTGTGNVFTMRRQLVSVIPPRNGA